MLRLFSDDRSHTPERRRPNAHLRPDPAAVPAKGRRGQGGRSTSEVRTVWAHGLISVDGETVDATILVEAIELAALQGHALVVRRADRLPDELKVLLHEFRQTGVLRRGDKLVQAERKTVLVLSN